MSPVSLTLESMTGVRAEVTAITEVDGLEREGRPEDEGRQAVVFRDHSVVHPSSQQRPTKFIFL